MWGSDLRGRESAAEAVGVAKRNANDVVHPVGGGFVNGAYAALRLSAENRSFVRKQRVRIAPLWADSPPIISHSPVRFVSIQPSAAPFPVSELSQFRQKGYDRGAGTDFIAKEGGGELLFPRRDAKRHEEHLLSVENCFFPRRNTDGHGENLFLSAEDAEGRGERQTAVFSRQLRVFGELLWIRRGTRRNTENTFFVHGGHGGARRKPF